MQRVKQKAEQSKENRENIELPEEKVSIRGEPIPFKVRFRCNPKIIFHALHCIQYCLSG